METVILNGFYMTSREKAHHLIAKRLQLDEESTDDTTLLAALKSYSTPVQIIFFNEDEMKNNLGEYAEALLSAFRIAAAANHHLNVVFDD